MRAGSSTMLDQVSIPSALGSIILLDLAELACHSFDLNHSQPFLFCSDLTWSGILLERSSGGKSSEVRQDTGILFMLEALSTGITCSLMFLLFTVVLGNPSGLLAVFK